MSRTGRISVSTSFRNGTGVATVSNPHVRIKLGYAYSRVLVLTTTRVLEVEQKLSCLGPQLNTINREKTAIKKLVSDPKTWRLWSACELATAITEHKL